MRMVSGFFVCPIKATGKKQSGYEASQFFYLVRFAGATTNASTDRSQYPDPCWRWLGLACETYTLPVYFSKLFGQLVAVMLFRLRAVCLASLYSFHPIRAACKPFSQLSSSSAWLINGTTLFA